MKWKFEGKPATAAELAFQCQFAAHSLCQFARDCQPQAGAAKAAGGGGIGLTEWTEQTRLNFWGNADTSIDDCEIEPSLTIALAANIYFQ